MLEKRRAQRKPLKKPDRKAAGKVVPLHPVPGDLPPCPEGFDEEDRALFRSICGVLAQAGEILTVDVMTVVDAISARRASREYEKMAADFRKANDLKSAQSAAHQARQELKFYHQLLDKVGAGGRRRRPGGDKPPVSPNNPAGDGDWGDLV